MAKAKQLKYEDKSSGQEALIPIFNGLKEMIAAYAGGNYVVKEDGPGKYSIYYGKPVTVAGRDYPELCFASVLVQKGYVGLYFFPIYVHESLKSKLSPALLKRLKGKTCFHIKQFDDGVRKDVKQALEIGVQAYASQGWKR